MILPDMNKKMAKNPDIYEVVVEQYLRSTLNVRALIASQNPNPDFASYYVQGMYIYYILRMFQ